MKFEVGFEKLNSDVRIELPFSKSMLNRSLIIYALSGKASPKLPDDLPNDIVVLQRILWENEPVKSAEDAGTAMRFATAYLAQKPGDWGLRGTDRMHERPIGILVEALRKHGAEIEYLGAEGFPPLKISGKKLKGGNYKVASNVSSQFISAILLIAPYMSEKLKMDWGETPASLPYIELTLSLMQANGVKVKRLKTGCVVYPGEYEVEELNLERDWSSAAYFFGLVAVAENLKIEFPGLSERSAQGDSIVSEMFGNFGVRSEFNERNLSIWKDENLSNPNIIEIDFTDYPDLVQPMVMTSMAVGKRMKLKGLINLHLKETNRLKALEYNVEELGGEFRIEGLEAELIPGDQLNENPPLKGFGDHRMVMSLLPLLVRYKNLQIPDVETARKSFPKFFREVEKLGFTLNEIH